MNRVLGRYAMDTCRYLATGCTCDGTVDSLPDAELKSSQFPAEMSLHDISLSLSAAVFL